MLEGTIHHRGMLGVFEVCKIPIRNGAPGAAVEPRTKALHGNILRIFSPEPLCIEGGLGGRPGGPASGRRGEQHGEAALPPTSLGQVGPAPGGDRSKERRPDNELGADRLHDGGHAVRLAVESPIKTRADRRTSCGTRASPRRSGTRG